MELPAPELVQRFRAALAALGGGSGPFGLAVSGGPDSLALLLLAHAAFPGGIRAATVDHGLRAESRDEALTVARVCAALGCPHDILTVEVPPGGEGIQSEARRVRYRALGAWIRAHGISRLLTAHHADDQAETLLMRLQRGSGIAGLAGVRARRPFLQGGEDALILRPLLGWRRSELADIVEAAGIEPADDPSNRDEAYDRVRIRNSIAAAAWLDALAMARSAQALADAEEALGWAADRIAAERIAADGETLAFDPAGLPDELVRRLVLRCIRAVAPEASPRGEQLSSLVQSLSEGGTATLSGVKCSGGSRFRFEPAPPRRG